MRQLRVSFGIAPQGTERLNTRSNPFFLEQAIAEFTLVFVESFERDRGFARVKSGFCPGKQDNFFRQCVAGVTRDRGMHVRASGPVLGGGLDVAPGPPFGCLRVRWGCTRGRDHCG